LKNPNRISNTSFLHTSPRHGFRGGGGAIKNKDISVYLLEICESVIMNGGCCLACSSLQVRMM